MNSYVILSIFVSSLGWKKYELDSFKIYGFGYLFYLKIVSVCSIEAESIELRNIFCEGLLFENFKVDGNIAVCYKLSFREQIC